MTSVSGTHEAEAVAAIIWLSDAVLRAQLRHHLLSQPGINEINPASQGNLAGRKVILFYDSQSDKAQLPYADWLVALGSSNNDALAAFESGAQGFIPCPIDQQQVTRVINHFIHSAQEDVQRKRLHTAVREVARQLSIVPEKTALACQSYFSCDYRPRITLRSENAWCSLFCDDIQWVQAAGDYMCVYTSRENFVIRSTLTDLCNKLPGDIFKRVSRSELVNIKFVKRVEQRTCRTAYVILLNDTQLKISQRYFSIYWQSTTDFNR